VRKWIDTAPAGVLPNRVRDFVDFVVTLDLVPTDALKATVDCSDGEVREIQDWLGDYADGRTPHSGLMPTDKWKIDNAFQWLQAEHKRRGDHISSTLEKTVRAVLYDEMAWAAERGWENEIDEAAYLMLTFAATCTLIPWQYPYHLGIFGIYRLFASLAKRRSKKGTGVFVVGELPEELTSYRHMIAHWLNVLELDQQPQDSAPNLRAFTGDIGLHIGLQHADGHVRPSIRCAFCNYNNEAVCRGMSYHSPEKVYETPIKRLEGAMLYLCTQKDHHPECAEHPRHFLSRPELRVI
jgi:hypothetical protein